jgi:hypothetical protein
MSRSFAGSIVGTTLTLESCFEKPCIEKFREIIEGIGKVTRGGIYMQNLKRNYQLQN